MVLVASTQCAKNIVCVVPFPQLAFSSAQPPPATQPWLLPPSSPTIPFTSMPSMAGQRVSGVGTSVVPLLAHNQGYVAGSPGGLQGGMFVLQLALIFVRFFFLYSIQGSPSGWSWFRMPSVSQLERGGAGGPGPAQLTRSIAHEQPKRAHSVVCNRCAVSI